MADKPAIIRNLDAVIRTMQLDLSAALNTLVMREYSDAIEFIQLLDFNEKLDDNQKQVLRKVMDYLIQRRNSACIQAEATYG